MNKTQHMQHNSTSFVRNYGNAMSLLAQALPSGANPCLFDFPFNELLVSTYNYELIKLDEKQNDS